MIHVWRYFLTPVSKCIAIKNEGNQSALNMISGQEKVTIQPSGEEGVLQIKA